MTTTTANEIETVIFDLGAVLIDWNPEYLYRKIFDREADMQEFLQDVCTPEWNAQQDAGRSWAEAVQILSDRHPNYSPEIRAYWDRWPEMLNGPIEGSVRILKKIAVQQKYRLLALTNWSAETWPYAWEQYDFLQLFEGILVSGAEALKKPDERIYRLLIERYDFDPGKALFIDDSPANVLAAQKVGIHALHFTSPAALEADLEVMGIL
ncbi:MAG: HAD family phosphatase [Sinomicrobium sp.]|nr:HAD family phosphatase [Sinomicrobium sp.]